MSTIYELDLDPTSLETADKTTSLIQDLTQSYYVVGIDDMVKVKQGYMSTAMYYTKDDRFVLCDHRSFQPDINRATKWSNEEDAKEVATMVYDNHVAAYGEDDLVSKVYVKHIKDLRHIREISSMRVDQ